jgi:CheY-like chemotaxis protein
VTYLNRVLLVDDDATSNFLTARQLHRLEVAANVHTAESGQQALDWLSKPAGVDPDLILLDVNMPGMGGLEFLQRFRHLYPTSSTLVLILTTTTDALELGPFWQLGAAEVFAKPLTKEQISAVVQQYFSADGASEPATAPRGA